MEECGAEHPCEYLEGGRAFLRVVVIRKGPSKDMKHSPACGHVTIEWCREYRIPRVLIMQ